MRESRPALLVLVAVAALLASCAATPGTIDLPAPGASWRGGALVGTRCGAVQGHEDKDGTWAWLGIPFAAPPVGELRWKAPVDPEPWAGVLRARRFGSPCTQYGLGRAVAGSEDCLTLNVWRPRTPEDGLPVYVWIHGGGNSLGSSGQLPDYYGHRVASRSNMVFVSVNYRLGPLGWFLLPGNEGTPEDRSGNYGTLDLINALRWVRDNIRSFGGDPRRVLIAGESAGAMNVLSLLLSPLARGLYSHALAQSGMAITASLEEAASSVREATATLLLRARRARTLEEALGLYDTLGPAEVEAFLRSRTDRQLLRAYPKVLTGMIRFPFILRDGVVIPEEGYSALERDELSSRVPLIIGTNRDEVRLFLLLAGSVKLRDPMYDIIGRWRSDLWKADGADAVARRLTARAGAPPVWVYRFDWGSLGDDGTSVLPAAWGRRLGAFHALDVSFFLGNDGIGGPLTSILGTRENRVSKDLLSDAMMRYVAAFVRGGDPNPPDGGLPRWESWSNDPAGPKTLILDADETGLRIRPLEREFTVDGVNEAFRRELSPEDFQEALARVEESGIVMRSDP